MNVDQETPELEYITPDDGTASDAAEPERELDASPEADLDGGEGNDEIDLEGDEHEDGDEPVSEEETEEVEFSGKKFKIPKELRPALMMQADYTRKTQELAERNRGLDSEKASVEQQKAMVAQHSQAVRQNLQGYAQLMTIDQQLEEFSKVNWEQYDQQDFMAAQTAYRRFQALKEDRHRLAGNLQRQEAELQRHSQLQAQQAEAELKQRQEAAARETLAVLQREIKGWNDKVAAEVAQFATSQGYTRDELISATGDPRAFKLLHKAMSYDKLVAARKAAQPKPEQAKPLSKVAGRSAPAVAGLDDRLSAEEWAKRRNAQVRGRA